MSPHLLASSLVLATALTGSMIAQAATPVTTERIQLSPPEDTGGPIPADALQGAEPLAPEQDAPTDAATGEDPAAAPLPIPEVHYGEAGLPKPVARMRAQLLEAAYSGDLERLRMVLEGNELMPTLTFGEMADPVETLKAASGDGEGLETLAILTEILEAGYVHVDKGTAQEMYIWPYFARFPLDRLSREQTVEMYRIVTAGDLAEMEATGTWLFYRVGIGPDGTMHYFVAGD
ncbi:hypothetical protein [Stappia taiwanensis]|nr:hypothetical protein [Stappia taiwanensis]